jgi:thioredoxin-dependent peroxiredoxin
LDWISHSDVSISGTHYGRYYSKRNLNQNKEKVELSSFKGKLVLIYFYPKDDTPGCTAEACEFRNHYKEFQQKGVTILGVSRQDAESHQKFRKKYHLPFDLLSDQDGKFAKSLGVETMPVIGFHQRQSLLIGRDGKVIKFYSKVDPKTHSQEILKEIRD